MKRVHCFSPICNISCQILFSSKKWNLWLFSILSCYHLHYLSWCLEYVCHKKFNLSSPFFSCHGTFSISVIKSRIFDQSFLRNIWKCYMLTPFCLNTHVNWLKCCHVTTLNHWWSHIECYPEDSFIRNCLINLFPLYEQRADLSIFFSQHLMQVMNCGGGTKCAGWTICVNREKFSVYLSH